MTQIGATNFPLTVHGHGFVDGLTVSVTGVRGHKPTTSVSNVSVVDSGTVQFDVSVTRGAKIGWASVVLTNPDGTVASCNGCLQVTAGPVVTAVSPSSVAAGISTAVTITGKNFAPGAKVSSSGGVRITGEVVQDETTISATVTPPAATPAGNYHVTVLDPVSAGAGSGTCTCLAVTAS